MPSIVLLIRSRLRIRPLSFSMRIPRRSIYWRLILRRPASSLGRSASSSGSSAVSAKSYSSRLDDLVLRTLAIVLNRLRLAVAADIAAVFLADQIKALAAEAREQRHFAFRVAVRTKMLLLELAAAFFCSFCFLFRHDSVPI